MVSQYQKKSLFFLRKSSVFGALIIFRSSRPACTLLAEIRHVRSRATKRIVTCFFFLNVMVKIRRNSSTYPFSLEHPYRLFWTFFFWLKRMLSLHSRELEKAQKSLLGKRMHSIAFRLPGLRHIHQLWGRWHHHNGFTISKKNRHKCLTAEKRACFCTILHIFGECWQNLAYFCLLLHHFA